MLHKPILEKLTWDEVFQDVLAVNPELAYIVHMLEPGNTLPLYRIRYPYGSLIVNDGIFYIPNSKGELVPVSDHSIPSEIQEAFSYSGDRIPIGVLLNKTVESFFNVEGTSFPWSLYEAGAVLGKLDPTDKHYSARAFTISAGARSLFSIPNIGDATLHKNLKRDFNIQDPPPKNLSEQWDIFNKVLLHPEVKSGWITELVFFPADWIKKIYNDNAWKSLQFYFLSYAWRQTGLLRNKLLCDFALSYIQHERNLKPNPYLADTAKYLLIMATGAVPGFVPAVDDTAAPIVTLQEVWIKNYGLKKYVPTFMHLSHFNFEREKSAVYYSLQHPTTFEFSPKSRQLTSTTHDLSELKYILDVYLEELRKDKLKIGDTYFGRIIKEINFDFFHTKPDKYGEIQLTEKMPATDPRLIMSPQRYGKREFASSGTFVRGCIKISRNEELKKKKVA